LGIHGSELFSDLMALVFKKRELISILGQELKAELVHYNPYHIIDEYLSEIPSDYSYLQKLRYLDLKLTLPDDMLVKVDRMSMFNSLEVRPLFLHPDIVDFALKLPDTLISTTDTSKVFLKKAMRNILPSEILYRTKMGFGMPFNKWVQSELKNQFLKTTSVIPVEYIKQDRTQSIYDLHKKNKRDFSYQLHSMMALGAWME
jgi:asparagine synthase (glutamine-hydrolysing)